MCLSSCTPSAFASGAVTFTRQTDLKPPSSDVAVISAVPCALAVTVPLDTDATFILLVFHRMFLFVAFEGVIFVLRFSVSPFRKSADVLSMERPVTFTIED